MDDRIAFLEADAVALPFADDAFDAALCLSVGMNIADKAQACREVRRVLKPGGRVVWSEVALGPTGPVLFPLPWARIPADSFLVPPQVLRQTFTKTGFHILDFVDDTDRYIKLSGDSAPAENTLPAHRVANEVVLGDDFIERRQNFLRNIMGGRLVSILIEAEKPR